jgi:hypothetical protein
MKGFKGWYFDSYKHSLAAKGIRTSLVANSRKGNRSRPEDLRWDPERQKYIDWRKRASALGFETGNKRKTLVGDTPNIVSPVNIYKKLEPFRTFPVPEAPTPLAPISIVPEVPEQIPLVPEVPAPEMEIPPAEALPYAEEEQQAQPVEGRPSLEVSASPRLMEEKAAEEGVGVEKIIETPEGKEIVTSGVPQVPSPLAEEITEFRYE